MREILVTDLVANVLGPRGGTEEEMRDSPISEYITGILAPAEGGAVEDESGIRDAEIGENSSSFDDDSADFGAGMAPAVSPVLSPQSFPPSIGMTFHVKFDDNARFDMCVTWAKYVKSDDGVWKRAPRHAVLSAGKEGCDVLLGGEYTWLDGQGGISDSKNAEVSIIARYKEDGHHASVSVFMTNRTRVDGETRTGAEHHIFQPQIRILCRGSTEVIPRPSTSGEDEETEILYADKKAFGRGHMVSVVWKGIDPEVIRDDTDLDDPARLNAPGFTWVDAKALSDADRERFSKADIRTEFVPMYSVMSPDVDEWPSDSRSPRLGAKFYSELYDADSLKSALEPFDTEYGRWVGRLKKDGAGKGHIMDKIVSMAEDAHRRIRGGIDLLYRDDDARLAFCFASRAVWQQAMWSDAKNEFAFRPFQMAFVLLSAESTLNRDSTDRGVCDLLWVPTGTGKTEAYLFLVAMTAAYRRLKAQKMTVRDRSGAGVSVISRYTLRLLTIQQFRRALNLFVAMEYLRVSGLGESAPVGWRPTELTDKRDFLWGTARFSVGLWVGSTVTPNKLEDRHPRLSPGALTILANPNNGTSAEPAQVLDCPACKATLTLPQDGKPPGNITLHHIIRINSGTDLAAKIRDHETDIESYGISNVKINLTSNHGKIFTLTTLFDTSNPLTHNVLSTLCRKICEYVKGKNIEFEYLSLKSRPGYFIKKFIVSSSTRYDFEVFCPNPSCPLNTQWAAGAHMGNANGPISTSHLTNTIQGIKSPDSSYFTDINEAFEVEPHVSDRIPIPAYTVDEQVFANVPTMIVSTVDKFARLPFEARSAQLFGNVDHHHHVRGYYRQVIQGNDKHPQPTGRSVRNYIGLNTRLEHPDLIIQDELHLIDGALGSMVGMYETAIDHLASTKSHRIKYVASTATIRQAESHVRALFARDLMVFPPQGTTPDDRFFVRGKKSSPLREGDPGRLYVGICAPGKGPLTPIVHIWSRLACSLNDNENNPHIDDYWTVTGYFNAVRELAGARSLYKQDIPEWTDHISGDHKRDFEDSNTIELSGRTQSSTLPSLLERLEAANRKTGPDALFTTSMFGTGVDVSKINSMIVNGQPKTSSSYIQATGRVGRKRGAIVVTFYRASRPRDLNHYEFFCRHHMQLHRFVEPPTVFPFSSGVMENAMGPVMVGILRNKREHDAWVMDATRIKDHANSDDVRTIMNVLRGRAKKQPKIKRPSEDDVRMKINNQVDRWREAAALDNGLRYYEYEANFNVVLGDLRHAHAGKGQVYDNVQQSMRGVEEEAEFEA